MIISSNENDAVLIITMPGEADLIIGNKDMMIVQLDTLLCLKIYHLESGRHFPEALSDEEFHRTVAPNGLLAFFISLLAPKLLDQ